MTSRAAWGAYRSRGARAIAVAATTPAFGAEDWQLLKDWLHSVEARNFTRSTVTTYRYTAIKFVLWCHDNRLTLANVDHRDVQDWLEACHLKARARYSYTSRICTMYEWLVREELLSRNPTRRVDRPKCPQGLPRPAPLERIQVALAHAEPRVAAMIALGAFAGMRRSEIAGLRREDLLLNHDPAEILIRGKGRKERLLPLHQETLDAIIRHGLPEVGFVFPSPKGAHLTPGYVGKLISEELSTSAHLTTHQLRHFFATEIYRLSKDIRLTQELMGHSSPATTAIYTAWSRDDAHGVIARLNDQHQPQ